MSTKTKSPKTKRTATPSLRRHTATLAGARKRLRRDVDRAGEDFGSVVAALRRYSAAEKSVPPKIRSLHEAQAIAEELVETLVDAGVKFASRKEAPSQVAASIYAGWLAAFRAEKPDPVDWLFAVSLAAKGIEHAIRTADGAPEIAREIVSETGSV